MGKRRACLFLALEGALYAAFLLCDLTRLCDTTALKFAAIALLALAGLCAGRGRENRAVTVALLLTALADVFLLVLNRYYAVGVALFLAVQLLYAARLGWSAGHSAKKTILLRCVVALIAGAALARQGALYALSGAYIACFAVNLVHAVGQAVKAPTGKRALFALGLLLFFLCDLCVGANNLTVPRWLSEFVRVAMWGFYLPGQVLILLSTDIWKGENR